MMMNQAAKLEYTIRELDSEQLKFVRRWLDELEGANKKVALQLMELLMAGEISDEEALKALDRIKLLIVIPK